MRPIQSQNRSVFVGLHTTSLSFYVMEFAQTGVGPIKEFSKTPETTAAIN